MPSSILVTGGAGYIGSHTVLQLLSGGYKAVVVDNLDNSSEIAIKRVKELAAERGSNLTFHKVNKQISNSDIVYPGHHIYREEAAQLNLLTRLPGSKFSNPDDK